MKLYVPVYGSPDDWGELNYYFPGRIYFKTREEAVQYLANNGYISKGQKLDGGEWSWDDNELEKFEYVKKPRWDSSFYVISEINEGEVDGDEAE